MFVSQVRSQVANREAQAYWIDEYEQCWCVWWWVHIQIGKLSGSLKDITAQAGPVIGEIAVLRKQVSIFSKEMWNMMVSEHVVSNADFCDERSNTTVDGPISAAPLLVWIRIWI